MSTSSTFNFSKLLCQLLIPALLIVVVLSHANRWLAKLAHVPYVEYHSLLEGSKIIKARRALIQGNYPADCDIFFAGSSRTMADFSPRVVLAEIQRRFPEAKKLLAYNLGNVANDYEAFEKTLGEHRPHILILEYSPHLLLKGNEVVSKVPPSGTLRSFFVRYRAWLEDRERAWSARVRVALGLDEFLQVREAFPHLLWRAIRFSPHDFERPYLYARSAGDYGQVLEPDGQVDYRVYLPNRRAAEVYREVAGTAYESFRENLSTPFLENRWRALERIAEKYAAPGYHLVLVRPPVAPELYALENNLQGPTIAHVRQWAHEARVAYLDLNPHSYFAADMTHLDWFDVASASRALGHQLSQAFAWRN